MAKREKPAVRQSVILRPLAYEWFRGPARRVGDDIVIAGAKATRYEPMLEKTPAGIALMRVRTPEEAVGFVESYGVLKAGSLFQGEPTPREFRQSYAELEHEAQGLRLIWRTVLDVRKAAEGDQEAMSRIRQEFQPTEPDADVSFLTHTGERVTYKARDVYRPERLAPQNDRSIQIRAADWAATSLTQGMDPAHPYVFADAQLFPKNTGAPGALRVGILPQTLLGYCYLSVAEVLARERVSVCEWCQLPLVVNDARRRFCGDQCGGWSRQRTYKNKHPKKTSKRDGGRSAVNEQPTRTR
jgi:hypothetical protein